MADGSPKFTVGVGTHFRPDRLAALFESLYRQAHHPDELIVIHSNDDATVDVLQEHEGRFEERGIDFRRARKDPDTELVQEIRNRIIALANGDVICFLDDDTVCLPNWFESIRQAYEENPDVVAVGGPAIKSDAELEPYDELDDSSEPKNEITVHGGVRDESGRWVPPEPVVVDICRGANMSFRKSFLEDVGGFDTGYKGLGAFEEWDVMAKLNDGSLLYHPDAFVYHIEETEGGTRKEQESAWSGVYWYARNSVRFRRNHASKGFARSLAHLFFRGGSLPPIWLRFGKLLLGSRVQFHWLRGYFDGVLDRGGNGATPRET